MDKLTSDVTNFSSQIQSALDQYYPVQDDKATKHSDANGSDGQLSKRTIRAATQTANKSTEMDRLRSDVKNFSSQIQTALDQYYPVPEDKEEKDNGPNGCEKQLSKGTIGAATQTANAAAGMLQASFSSEFKTQSKVLQIKPITALDSDQVIHKAKACLAWAHDPARKAIPGAENVTKDQVCGQERLAKGGGVM